MAATLLDGKSLANDLCEKLAESAAVARAELGRPPGLAVILVGNDPASAVYVRNKERRAQQVGLMSKIVRLPETASQAAVEAAVEALNADDSVDAFLLQLPLPVGLDAVAASSRIAPHKDADGLHPINMGRLVAGTAGPRPCTPAGVMELLAHGKVPLAGAHAVVLGRSTIVGKPMALLLLDAHATVTICHSRTTNLAAEVARADVLVAAVGQPELVRGAWVKAGAAVIDVGINRLGDRLVGDVEFAAARARASCITPVPGGVGPMTIAMLLRNTVACSLSQ